MAHCNEYLELISAALDGALSPAEQTKLDSHLSACPDCRALAEDLKALHKGLSALPAAEPPADLKDRIMAAVAADNVTPFVPKKQTQPWKRWGACAAAVALILAGAYGMRDYFPINKGAAGAAAPESVGETSVTAEGQALDSENGLAGDSVPESIQGKAAAVEPGAGLPQTYSRSAAGESEAVYGGVPEQTAPANPGQAAPLADSSSLGSFQSPKETGADAGADAPRVSLFIDRAAGAQPILEPASADSGNSLTEAPSEAPATAGLDAYPRFYSVSNFVVAAAPGTESEVQTWGEQQYVYYTYTDSGGDLNTAAPSAKTTGSAALDPDKAPTPEVNGFSIFRGNVTYTNAGTTLSNSAAPDWAQRRNYSHINGVPAKEDGSDLTVQEAMGLMADFTSQTGTLDSAFTEEDGLFQCVNTLSGRDTVVNIATYERRTKAGDYLFTLSTPGSSDPAWYSVSRDGSMVERIQAPDPESKE